MFKAELQIPLSRGLLPTCEVFLFLYGEENAFWFNRESFHDLAEMETRRRGDKGSLVNEVNLVPALINKLTCQVFFRLVRSSCF
jgi:hypothetical protein